MEIRTTKPEAGNKYYIKKDSGGWNPGITGKPTDPDCNVLSNCVSYAIGRFNEEINAGYCKYLKKCNAENFIRKNPELESGQTPRTGACMCWEGLGSKAGHVAIVEKVISEIEVITSESAWNGKPFYNKTRHKGSNGNWGMSRGSYSFNGFLYNPEIKEDIFNLERTLLYGKKGADVKKLQECLGGLVVDGIYGTRTKTRVKEFQKNNKLKVDGIVGKNTAHALGWLFKGE